MLADFRAYIGPDAAWWLDVLAWLILAVAPVVVLLVIDAYRPRKGQ